MATTTISTRRKEIRTDNEVSRGAATMAPLMLGYAPFALIVGATVAEHVNPAAGWTGTWTIFGGSAHLAGTQLRERRARRQVARGLGSYALRAVPLLAAGRVQMPESADRLLRYAGPAAIASLVVPSVKGQHDASRPELIIGAIAAVLVALAVTRRRPQLALVVIVGLAAYWIVRLAASALI